MDNQNLAIKVKDLRNRKGFSQEQLAEESKLSLRTIQRIEKGKTTPRGDTLIRLTKALGVTSDDLLDWTKIEDSGYLGLLNLSALTIILHPILGIVIPVVLWLYKKEKVRFVDDTGKRLINFQISWSLLFYSIILVLTRGMLLSAFEITQFVISDVIYSLYNNLSYGASFMLLLYGYNIFLVLINTRRNLKGKECWYKPAIPFLK